MYLCTFEQNSSTGSEVNALKRSYADAGGIRIKTIYPSLPLGRHKWPCGTSCHLKQIVANTLTDPKSSLRARNTSAVEADI